MSPDETYIRVDDDVDGSIWLWCPGCDGAHRITLRPGSWTWDGDSERPTISPSILVNADRGPTGKSVCHSFVRAGLWEFLADSTHALAGQTVPVFPLPDWLRE